MSTTQNFACLSRLEKKEKLLNIYKEDKHKKKKKNCKNRNSSLLAIYS